MKTTLLNWMNTGSILLEPHNRIILTQMFLAMRTAQLCLGRSWTLFYLLPHTVISASFPSLDELKVTWSTQMFSDSIVHMDECGICMSKWNKEHRLRHQHRLIPTESYRAWNLLLIQSVFKRTRCADNWAKLINFTIDRKHCFYFDALVRQIDLGRVIGLRVKRLLS